MSDENKYELLINTLDSIIDEAPHPSRLYDVSDDEKINHARSRALIHLFLRTRFGLLDFSKAEALITDGSNDGGLDAYYIDSESKIVYLVQSKFRTTQENFENRSVNAYDLFKMDLGLITNGEEKNANGIKYNGKILGCQRAIRDISDIGKYKYCLVFLGNIPASLDPEKLKEVSGSVCNEVEVINGADTYNSLLLPYLQSDFYNKREFVLKIRINQNQSNRINYSVKINGQSININLSFIPTVEIASMMREYKNSLLKYNPRCYVGIKNGGVNQQIHNSISETESNEFSLLNNGITVICTDFEYTERNAEPNSATLLVSNPQIVNGGQTAFTLSKIQAGGNSDLFTNKEVLVKFISLNQEQTPDQTRLIEKISEATNNQTPVNLADRKSNDEKLIELQKYFFEHHGLLLERKRGEFYEMIDTGIINKNRIVKKEQVMRLLFVMDGKMSEARSYSTAKLFKDYPLERIDCDYFIYVYNIIKIYKLVESLEQKSSDQDEKYKTDELGAGLRYGKYAMAGVIFHKLDGRNISNLITVVAKVKEEWKGFEIAITNHEHNKDYFDDGFNFDNYYKGKTINKDLVNYFQLSND
jgi:AIPR protein